MAGRYLNADDAVIEQLASEYRKKRSAADDKET